MNIIIEGIDHIGKDTLINKLKTDNDVIIHSGAPESLEKQRNFFDSAARFSVYSPQRVIFNRFHIGECVYGPLYRNTPGDWVFPLVEQRDFCEKTKLILLTMDQDYMPLRKYDKDAFDFKNAINEQTLFCETILNKTKLESIIIGVIDKNTHYWKHPDNILNEVLSFIEY